MPNRIRAEGTDGDCALFRIDDDDVLEGGADIRLVSVALQISDSSLFGKSQFPLNSQAYDVETNDPKCRAHLLHIARENKIVVHAANGQIKEYEGSLLEAILRAYKSGAFRA